MTIAAIILAAGRGTRAGGGVPKQWRDLAGLPVVARSYQAFHTHPGVDRVVVVVDRDAPAGRLLPYIAEKDLVLGGENRAASVMAGLECLEGTADHVLIHDGARPLVSAELIGRVIEGLKAAQCVAPGVAVSDALWVHQADHVTGIQARDGILRAQTPQGFDLAAILAAHRAFDGNAADDVEVALAYGLTVTHVAGDEDNLKITTAHDFDRGEQILGDRLDIRTGTGFDVHRFGPGDQVTLCGVSIPHDRALQGHSNADVGMHAITDAIYGALAEGDIGRHFPPSDPKWKGADSAVFLAHAVQLVGERGFGINNVDCTLVCEQPKIGPHAAAMQERLAEIIGIEVGRVSVKATTSEQLGFTGRGEGIAAQAIVTLRSK